MYLLCALIPFTVNLLVKFWVIRNSFDGPSLMLSCAQLTQIIAALVPLLVAFILAEYVYAPWLVIDKNTGIFESLRLSSLVATLDVRLIGFFAFRLLQNGVMFAFGLVLASNLSVGGVFGGWGLSNTVLLVMGFFLALYATVRYVQHEGKMA